MFNTVKEKVLNIFYSFPIQLIILHLRSNVLLLILWVFLALLLTGQFARSFGFRHLFLNPEYLGQVNGLSYFLVGLAFGGLSMSWNLTTYLLSTHHFAFLATLKRPLTKFSLNNAVIPLAFFFLYVIKAGYSQIYNEYYSISTVILNLSAFTFGTICTIIFFGLYLTWTNRDISFYLKRLNKEKTPNKVSNLTPGRRGMDIDRIKSDENRWRVDTYLSEQLKPRMVRSVAHYESKFLLRIFKQNHLNAFYLQFGLVVLLMGLGYLMDFKIFRIPAGASIFILMSISFSVIGAINYWLHRWRVTMLIVFLISINFLTKSSYFSHQNQSYGLDYQKEQAEYSFERLKEMIYPDSVMNQADSVLTILENWRAKFGEKNPKLIITSVSGGGLKAAVWATKVLQTCDSVTNNRFMPRTALMTGASGGMIGSSYYRSLYLEKIQGKIKNQNDPIYLKKISKDLLNSISFSIVSNDIFLPFAEFKYGEHRYIKDRGYMFEKQLNENTDYILDKPISYFRQPELEAKIPMVIISPAIVNDARRMLISPHAFSFLSSASFQVDNETGSEIDAVDFHSLFKKQEADSLRFTTALRMNATYPFILPNVHLPSNPSIEVMDAGFRDNMGILSAARFVQVYQDWLRENTEGVALVHISSMNLGTEITPSDNQGIVESMLYPLGIFGHILRLQNFEHDANLSYLYDIMGPGKFEVIRMNYRPTGENELASMSFHLTNREKNDIKNAINLPSNLRGLERIKQIVGKQDR